MNLHIRLILIFVIGIALASCGGDDSDDLVNDEPSGLAAIAGIWLLPISGDDLFEEVYFGFSEEGDYSVYVYLGSSISEGQNCFSIAENVAQISFVGDSMFTLSGFEGEPATTFSIVRDGDNLLMENLSEEDSGVAVLTSSAFDYETIISMRCEESTE